ncbi:50S ribosomal protein L13 [Candidatus Woesearchaeota archaeon]|nr:50S ribosomal protein L13 [Candidatus Woesearchaeota archaeon]
MTERIIDAKEALVGRLATVVAKAALLGDTIKIINCEQAVVSGTKQHILQRAVQYYQRGIHTKGPFVSRLPDRYVRRIIRGMLPHKQPKGIAAYRRIMCYMGIPEDLKTKTIENISEAHVSKLRGTGYLTIQEICTSLGGKR